MDETTTPAAGTEAAGETDALLPEEQSPEPGAIEERERRHRIVGTTREFLVCLDRLARVLILHHQTNEAIRAVSQQVLDTLGALQAEAGDLALVMAEGHAFVNGIWVRPTRTSWEAALEVTEWLKSLGARGVVLRRGVLLEGLLALAQTMRARRRGEPIRECLQSLGGIPGVRLLPLPRLEDRSTRRGQAFAVLRDGIITLTGRRGGRTDLPIRRRQRALVQEFIALAEESPEDLLALTTVRDPRRALTVHTLMVCIYSVALGRLLDLGRLRLLRLGMCALHHNIGESLLDPEIFKPARALSETERQTIELHPLLGLHHFLEHYGLQGEIVLRALVSAEHHIGHVGGGQGYPFLPLQRPHLFSRIIAVADGFDALASARPHRPAYPPDHALKLVIRAAGRCYDPVLTRAFVRLVGRYPTGSLLELDTGELAIVLGPGAGLDPLQRPHVLLIADERGGALPMPVSVDLGERHEQRRAWLRTTARSRHPSQLPRPVASYLFGERIVSPPVHLDKDDPWVTRMRSTLGVPGPEAQA